MKGNIVKKIVVAITALALAFTVMPAAGAADTYAATKVKTPSAPTITSGKAEGAKITIKWKSAKNAKKYQVALRTSYMGWKYLKKVKKTKANKAKYNKAKLYKTVAGKGKNKNKYYVYKYQRIYKYKTLKSATTSKSYTYSAPKRNSTYTLAVRSLNGKKHSGWKAKAVKTWSADTVRIDGAVHTHKWVAQSKTVEETITVMETQQTGTETVSEKNGIRLVCGTCGETLDTIGDVEGEYTENAAYTDEQITEITASHIESTGCDCEYTDTEDVFTEVDKPVYSDVPVEKVVTKTVPNGYKCSCGAVKNTSGTVTLHTHTWATREKYKTAYKTVEYLKDYIVCNHCEKRFIVHYRDADGVWHDYVERKNPDNWYSSCPEATTHQKEEMKINGYIGSMRDETEEYKTEKVAYKVPYTETYCTGCGKIK